MCSRLTELGLGEAVLRARRSRVSFELEREQESEEGGGRTVRAC